MKEKTKAFTLAEVLITLGIIGVIAAMTLPNLISTYKKKVYVTNLKKIYSLYLNAVQSQKFDIGIDDLIDAGLDSQNAVDTFTKKYFKVAQVCNNSLTPCMAASNQYSALNGTKLSTAEIYSGTSYLLPDGIAIRPLYVSGWYQYRTVVIFVDINGRKGPNILGRDAFFITIYRDGTIDDYGSGLDSTPKGPLSAAYRENLFTTVCNKKTGVTDYGCFGKILNDNWDMNY